MYHLLRWNFKLPFSLEISPITLQRAESVYHSNGGVLGGGGAPVWRDDSQAEVTSYRADCYDEFMHIFLLAQTGSFSPPLFLIRQAGPGRIAEWSSHSIPQRIIDIKAE